ncbi:MAG: radical SAM protein [Candidatus Hydrogenedens sp.]|nr:radical SAM protein [Candidatus Hydrogenedentota bacterium]NLF59241.1 radical SAM protein [Candidatus Hydrogenedens sp.]
MKRLKIFLANLGFIRPGDVQSTPPMGIMYLAAHVRRVLQADFLLSNQRVDGLSNTQLVAKARDFGADVVGFTALTPSAHALPEITAGVRAALPGALILVGGPHVSAVGADILRKTCADAAVPGEGEIAFEQILRRHLDGSDFSDIPGVHWRGRDGEIVSNPGSVPFIEDLDSLPFPAYDLLNLDHYWRLRPMTFVAEKGPYAALYSSRGCPYHCHWCHRVFGDKFRAHSAERVLAELDHYVRTYGVKQVEFYDDIFNYDPKRVRAIHDGIKERGLKLKISFPNGLRSDLLTKDTIDCLADMGTRYIGFALETGSPRLQKLMGKNMNIPRLVKAVEMAADRGIFTNGYAILGMPTETAEEMRETIRVAAESRLHTAQFFTLLPFPGTQIHRYMQEHKPEMLPFLNFDEATVLRSDINLSDVSNEELIRHQRHAFYKFYSRPSRVFRILRDFPNWRLLPAIGLTLAAAMTKGLLKRK